MEWGWSRERRMPHGGDCRQDTHVGEVGRKTGRKRRREREADGPKDRETKKKTEIYVGTPRDKETQKNVKMDVEKERQ